MIKKGEKGKKREQKLISKRDIALDRIDKQNKLKYKNEMKVVEVET